MQIIVQNKLIETTEIISVEEAGYRIHGFIIYLIDGSKIEITKKEDYDMMNHEYAVINKRYRVLKEKVIEYWEKDKTNIPILRL